MTKQLLSPLRRAAVACASLLLGACSLFQRPPPRLVEVVKIQPCDLPPDPVFRPWDDQLIQDATCPEQFDGCLTPAGATRLTLNLKGEQRWHDEVKALCGKKPVVPAK